MREIQQVKYWNKEISHTNKYLKAIPLSVLRRIISLTSQNKKALNSILYSLYLEYAIILVKLDLAPKISPKMIDIAKSLKLQEKTPSIGYKGGSTYYHKTYFCIGFCHVWRVKNTIYAILKKLREKCLLN